MQPTDLQIRAAVPGDADAIHRIHLGPSVYRNTLQLPHSSPEIWRGRVDGSKPGVYHLVAVAPDGELAGVFGLKTYIDNPRCAHAATFGISVAEHWQGRGVASRLMTAGLDLADNWLNLRRIELEVFIDNAGAIALYERFGFQREGVKRMVAFRDGEFVDGLVMARVRP